VSIALRDEVPQVTSRIRSRIVAKKVDEMGHVAAIGCEGRVDDSPLSLHPTEKLADQGTELGRYFSRNDPSFAQVTPEHANA
jgi:hypothetical protein